MCTYCVKRIIVLQTQFDEMLNEFSQHEDRAWQSPRHLVRRDKPCLLAIPNWFLRNVSSLFFFFLRFFFFGISPAAGSSTFSVTMLRFTHPCSLYSQRYCDGYVTIYLVHNWTSDLRDKIYAGGYNLRCDVSWRVECRIVLSSRFEPRRSGEDPRLIRSTFPAYFAMSGVYDIHDVTPRLSFIPFLFNFLS